MQGNLPEFFLHSLNGGAKVAQTTSVAKDAYFHFGDWLRWKRGSLPAKAWFPGDPRNLYNLEKLQSPGRLATRTLEQLSKATKLDIGDVKTAWQKESVPPEFRLSENTEPSAATSLDTTIALAARNSGHKSEYVKSLMTKLLLGSDPKVAEQLAGMASRSPAAKAAIGRKNRKQRGEE